MPDHWGIITIQSDHVIVNRPARAGNPACASQLSVLWKLELSNLLTKAGFPLYTYKSKEGLSHARTASRTPHNIPYTDIEVSLGVPWVSEGIISDFTYFLRTGNEAFAKNEDMHQKYVSYEPLTGYWYVGDKQCTHWRGDQTRIENTYGLPSYNALYILEAALNLREIRRETKEETLAAQEKQEAIEKLFNEWFVRDSSRKVWAVFKECGERLGARAPYGYCRSQDDRN